MTSFLDKLNEKLGKNIPEPPKKGEAGEQKAMGITSGADAFAKREELPIDLYQNPEEIIIYCPAAGVDPQDFEIILDEEKDQIVIRGNRTRPEKAVRDPNVKDEDGRFLEQECKWEAVFRKVILPAEVDSSRAEALLRKGVLIIRLPILKPGEGVKLKVKEGLSGPDASIK